MIRIIFLSGQGIGNQLWLLFTSLFLADRLNKTLVVQNFNLFKGQRLFKNSLRNLFFLEEDLSFSIDDYSWYSFSSTAFCDQNTSELLFFRLDPKIFSLIACYDNILLEGIFQDPYLLPSPQFIRGLLVDNFLDKPDCIDRGTCLVNIRGGDYLGLFRSPCVDVKYFYNAFNYFSTLIPSLTFKIVTDDNDYASIIFPDLQLLHGDYTQDFHCLMHTSYAILCNTSFAFFPLYINETLEIATAPSKWGASSRSFCKNWHSPVNYYEKFLFFDANFSHQTTSYLSVLRDSVDVTGSNSTRFLALSFYSSHPRVVHFASFINFYQLLFPYIKLFKRRIILFLHFINCFVARSAS